MEGSILESIGLEIIGVMSPVSICMLLVVLLVYSLSAPSSSAPIRTAANLVYLESPSDSATQKLEGALLNALVFVVFIALVTFLLVLLYYYNFTNFLKNYTRFSAFFVLGTMGGSIFLSLIQHFSIPIDSITCFVLLLNFTVVGVLSVFSGAVPIFLRQAYMVALGIIVAAWFTKLPEWTTWVLLVALAVYDLVAVLAPGGPLKILVELASSRDEELPALVYEARPTVSRNVGSGGSSLGLLVGGVSDSNSVELQDLSRNNQNRNQGSVENRECAAIEIENSRHHEVAIGSEEVENVKKLIDTNLYSLLGERTAADDEKPKKKKEKPVKIEEHSIPVDAPPKPSEEELNPFSIFPSPEENYKVHTEVFFSDRPVLRACNSREILEKHLKATGGKVFTRFPPEPNGYLHIGHAKAMFIDFGLAKERGGCCYLRYDDTNPEAEKKEYIDHIEEIVSWMGWKPFKITYTSDYFQDLYELAVELIRRGHAYVDHQTPEEIKEYREKKMNSPWRDRPIAESLKLFDDMKRGMIEEGKATLRMKQDMQSDNYNMYDLIAYRIKFTPHPHAGDKWCIYPSYDYAHCIVDSLENITHSLCTLEFETRRASYYWLLDALGLYQPYVWEYSRLNVTNTVMSKRKLNRLVTAKWVDGWDDPRLMTLAGLRRRGVTSTSINAFVKGIGITRSDSSIIQLDRLEYHIREELNKEAPRTLVVLHPLKVVITNLEAGSVMDLDAKKWPDAQIDQSSVYKVPFSNVVYIEHSDFRMKDSKDYYGLAPGKSVLLRYAFPIKCTDVVIDDDKETILEVRAEYDPLKKSKPKGVLHWVAETSPGVDPLKVEVRLFDRLFLSENPAELDDWLGDLNPESKVVIKGAYSVPSLKDAAVGDRFQFERLGYFVVDKDSTTEKLIFNRTVTLRDSYNKAGK